MAGQAADGSAINAAASLSEVGDGLPLSGGFFLLCTKPGEDKTRETRLLQQAFSELGFSSPVIVSTETCIVAA
ncbi:MAG: hypothetical protein WCA23_04605, partial [Stellaceae bacterium]